MFRKAIRFGGLLSAYEDYKEMTEINELISYEGLTCFIKNDQINGLQGDKRATVG